MRHTRRYSIFDYLKSYPEVEQRWINRCVLCGHIGYKPEMEPHARGAHHLLRELGPLPLDELGRCEVRCGR